MPYKTLARFAVVSVFAAAPAFAQAQVVTENPLIGTWTSECDAWGKPARCTSTWRPGTHASHLVQEYAIVRKHDGHKLFSGRGVYRITDESVHGFWEDSQGAIHPLTGTYQNGAITVIWGTPETEMGRSSYAYEAETLLVHDASLTQEGWREFMAIEYERESRSTD
jgi:hypothetical protein